MSKVAVDAVLQITGKNNKYGVLRSVGSLLWGYG